MMKSETYSWKEDAAQILEQLASVLADKSEVLILSHRHPDPDAIASSWGLKLLIEQHFSVRASISYSGAIARAENRAMVKRLGIPLKQYNRIKLSRYDSFIMVDTQPGAGNNALNNETSFDLIIDHHPLRKDTQAALCIVDPDIGASATIVIALLKSAGVELSADLATALAYAISSETQNMHREAAKEDISAYLSVYVRASIRKLAQILNANLPHYYFLQLGHAVNNAKMFGTIICSHLETIRHPEIVAEMADFLLKHERIGAVLVSGCFKEQLILSLRTGGEQRNAGELIKQLPIGKDNAGGHDRSAGGFIDLTGKSSVEVQDEVRRIQTAFASLFGYENPQWRPLLDD